MRVLLNVEGAYILVIERVHYVISTLLGLKDDLGNHIGPLGNDTATQSDATNRGHCALNICNRSSRYKVLGHDNVWAGESSNGYLRCRLLSPNDIELAVKSRRRG
jgi:hypothetical protein